MGKLLICILSLKLLKPIPVTVSSDIKCFHPADILYKVLEII